MSISRTLPGLLVLSAFILSSSACGASFECTAIGCVNEFRLELKDSAGEPVTEFVGSVRVGEASVGFACRQNLSLERAPSGMEAFCSSAESGVLRLQVFGEWERDTPVELNVRNAEDTLRFTGEVAIGSITEARPNGPLCPPVCRSGNATVTLTE